MSVMKLGRDFPLKSVLSLFILFFLIDSDTAMKSGFFMYMTSNGHYQWTKIVFFYFFCGYSDVLAGGWLILQNADLNFS